MAAAGTDTASYFYSTEGVVVSLAAGASNTEAMLRVTY